MSIVDTKKSNEINSSHDTDIRTCTYVTNVNFNSNIFRPKKIAYQ